MYLQRVVALAGGGGRGAARVAQEAVVLGRLQAIEMLREFDGLAELPT